MLQIRNDSRDILIHCKGGGEKDWYGGNELVFSTKDWEICSSGSSDTLIIERTSTTLKLTQAEGCVEMFRRGWAADDGKCLSDTGFWRLQNYGTTVLTAESVLGTVFWYCTVLRTVL